MEQILREKGSCNTCGGCECRSPTDCMDKSQWRCRNCSYIKRAMEKLVWYLSISECPNRRSLWWSDASMSLFAEGIFVSKWLSLTKPIFRFVVTSTRCVWAPFTQCILDVCNVFHIWGCVQCQLKSRLSKRWSSRCRWTCTKPLDLQRLGSYCWGHYCVLLSVTWQFNKSVILRFSGNFYTWAFWNCASSCEADFVV